MVIFIGKIPVKSAKKWVSKMFAVLTLHEHIMQKLFINNVISLRVKVTSTA